MHSSRMSTAPSQTPQLAPWVRAWKPARHAWINTPTRDLQGMLGYHLQGMLGYHHPHPPWTEFLTHASENITLPQTSFAGGIYMSFICTGSLNAMLHDKIKQQENIEKYLSSLPLSLKKYHLKRHVSTDHGCCSSSLQQLVHYNEILDTIILRKRLSLNE